MLKSMFSDDTTFLPSTAKLEGEAGYFRPTKVSKEVFDGLVRTWGSKECNPYDMHGTRILAMELGNKDAGTWIYLHDFKYGEAVYHGIVVK